MKLMNMKIHEVSLVDKAANKRKFAFMKRAEPVAKTEPPPPPPPPVAPPPADEMTAEEKILFDSIRKNLAALAAEIA